MRGNSFRLYAQTMAVGLLLTLSSFVYGPTDNLIIVPMPPAYSEIISHGLSDQALLEAIEGYGQMKDSQDLGKEILVVIDFSKSSNLERFYILDMRDTSLTKSLLVAHGKNSGNEYASSFSNIFGSYQSSLGFYRTAETYKGKHGLSLRLDGLEHGINHNARDRAIVIHRADYVNLEFAAEHGRIGRSLGCPALPIDGYEEVIDTIKEGCLLYIYGDDDSYTMHSSFISPS